MPDLEEEVAPFVVRFRHALPIHACHQIIQRFEGDPRNHIPGFVTGRLDPINRYVKDSTDLRISEHANWKDVDQILYRSLHDALQRYVMRYKVLETIKMSDKGYLMIRYAQQTGKFNWHADSSGSNIAEGRVLSGVWYLNDVEDGGETEFEYQQALVRPEAGSFVLFPPWWTHVHQGKVPRSGPKYIINTFLNYQEAMP